MTTQAIFAGKGLGSFSETHNVASGSGSLNVNSKTSFDNYMAGKSNDTSFDDKNVAKIGKDSSKTIVNKINQYDAITNQNDAGNTKDVNYLDVDVVNGEVCVVCVDNLEMKTIDIDELLAMISDFFSEKLDISKEELDKILAENGINVFGLFQMNNLQDVFADINGIEDFSMLLTDEELSQSWNELVNDIFNSELELNDIGVVSMSELRELFGNDDVIETINSKLSLNGDAAEEVSDNIYHNNTVGETEAVYDNNSFSDSESFMTGDETTETQILSDAGKNDSIEGKASFNENMFEVFMEKVQQSLAETDRFSQSQIQQIRDVSLQIIEGVKVNVKADTSFFELQLNPESLGKVQVAIEIKDGIATASFLVRDELVKTAVESQLQTLKDAFEENGLKVDKVEVSVSDFSFEQSNQTFSQEKDEKSGSKKASSNEINISGNELVNTFADNEEIVDEMNEGRINVTA